MWRHVLFVRSAKVPMLHLDWGSLCTCCRPSQEQLGKTVWSECSGRSSRQGMPWKVTKIISKEKWMRNQSQDFKNNLKIGKMLVPSSICCSLGPDRFDQSWRVAFLKFPFDLSLVMFSQSTVAGRHVWSVSVCDWGRIAAKDQYWWLVDELMSPKFDNIWCQGIQLPMSMWKVLM